ncbi:MAG: hypothetical protein ACRCZB_03770 [Bacteroidales bacterium]
MIKPIKRKPLIQQVVEVKKPVENKPTKASKKNTLPPDTYKDEFEPIDMFVDEGRKFVLSVKRGGDFGLPMCDIRQYQTTDVYEGFTKKGLNFPVELLPDLIELLQVIYGECEERDLID